VIDNPNQADDSQPGSEADGDSIEQAAEKEFDRGQAQTKQAQPKPLTDHDIWVQGKMQDEMIAAAVAVLQEAPELKNVDMEDLEGALHVKATKDPNFKKAATDQGKDPGAWKAALEAVRIEQVAKRGAAPKDKATEDLAAANASVKGDNNNKEAPNSKLKSNEEFGQLTQRQRAAYWDNRLDT